LNYGKTREIFLYLTTFTTNFYIVNFGNTLGFLGHLWSVAVQEQYYIVIPILLLLIPVRYIKLIAFISIGVGLFYRLYVYYHDLSFWHLHVSTLSCLDTFGVGTYIAYLSIYEKETFKKLIENKTLLRISVIILLFAAVFGTFFQKGNHYYLDFYRVVERTVVSFGTIWLVGYAYFDKYNTSINRLFQSKTILYLGKISYGIYLYHFFVTHICSIILNRMNLQVYNHIRYLLPIYFIITFIFATLSWELFEKPINKLKTKLY